MENPSDVGQERSITRKKIFIRKNTLLIMDLEPVLLKSFKDSHNVFGEPVYNVNLQQIASIDKMLSTEK